MTAHASDDLKERCRTVVESLLARYGWKLIDHDEYLRRVEACIRSGEAEEPSVAGLHVYCCCLYSACAGTDGHDLQEVAFIELHRYLFALSYKLSPDIPADVREEAVNETLLKLWEHMSQYRKPGAFLAIAAYTLRSVMRPMWSRPVVLSLDKYPIEHSGPVTDVLLETVQDNELRQQVQVCFDEMLRRHPRAKQQLEAVWLKYIAGLDDQAISRLLGKPVANVHVLRTRGMDQLREAPICRALASELGLEVPENRQN